VFQDRVQVLILVRCAPAQIDTPRFQYRAFGGVGQVFRRCRSQGIAGRMHFFCRQFCPLLD
jgi:hypothetical protein